MRNPLCNKASPASTGFDVAVTISVIRPPSVVLFPLTEHHLDGLQPGHVGDELAAGGTSGELRQPSGEEAVRPERVGQVPGVCDGGQEGPPKR
jgi:hypothetical protein